MSRRVDIFDLDDTLLLTPSFADFAKKNSDGIIDLKHHEGIDEYDKGFIDALKKVKSFFYIVFSKEIYFATIGDFIVLYDSKKRKPLSLDYINYVNEITLEKIAQFGLKEEDFKEIKKSLGEEKGYLVIHNISGFHKNPSTVGRDINDKVYNYYKSAQNRMIVTGRPESLRSVIDKRLFDLGLSFPNFGLFLHPSGKQSRDKKKPVVNVVTIKDFKVATILKSIEDNAWEEVHFYEDRKDWLQAVQNAVFEKFPNVKFHAHLIPQTRKI